MGGALGTKPLKMSPPQNISYMCFKFNIIKVGLRVCPPPHKSQTLFAPMFNLQSAYLIKFRMPNQGKLNVNIPFSSQN